MAQEVARLESLLAGRGVELTALQEEFRAFKARYAQTVGSRLAELSEVECEIRKAEERLLGVKSDAGAEDGEEDAGRAAFDDGKVSKATPAGSALRKLFWSVARMFHPDHSKDEGEARRRHAIMAEASRAYREGDLESLHTLLGDEELRSFCAAAHAHDEEEDLAARLLRLREELI
ncbi:MAG: hypothetical protein ACRD68_10380, partial [Pyrinomonadaceae bacterium]